MIGAVVCLLAAPRVQLFVSAGNGCPHGKRENARNEKCNESIAYLQVLKMQGIENHAKKGKSCFLTPTVVGGRCPLPSDICAQSDPLPSKNADFDRFPVITFQP